MSYPKKVLLIATHFAPAYKAGGIVRSLENYVNYFEIKQDIKIICGNTNLDDNEELPLQTDVWLPFNKNCEIFYISKLNRNEETIRNLIITYNPDVLFINGLFSFLFTIAPIKIVKKCNLNPIVIVAPWGMVHRGNLAVKPLKKKIYLSFVKTFGIFKNIRWHATNTQEKEDIQRIFGRNSDVAVASALPTIRKYPLQPIKKERCPLKLITVSLITPNKGHLRVLKALKELRGSIEVEYHIYGTIKDQAFWKLCLEEIKTLNSSIKVIYHGFIEPDEVSSKLSSCHFFILHTQGENFCQAIYESLSVGRPVIISDQTPWKDLQAKNAGWDLDIANHNALVNTIREAYEMTQSSYDMYCKGAYEIAGKYIEESDFDMQYHKLLN